MSRTRTAASPTGDSDTVFMVIGALVVAVAVAVIAARGAPYSHSDAVDQLAAAYGVPVDVKLPY